MSWMSPSERKKKLGNMLGDIHSDEAYKLIKALSYCSDKESKYKCKSKWCAKCNEAFQRSRIWTGIDIFKVSKFVFFNVVPERSIAINEHNDDTLNQVIEWYKRVTAALKAFFKTNDLDAFASFELAGSADFKLWPHYNVMVVGQDLDLSRLSNLKGDNFIVDQKSFKHSNRVDGIQAKISYMLKEIPYDFVAKSSIKKEKSFRWLIDNYSKLTTKKKVNFIFTHGEIFKDGGKLKLSQTHAKIKNSELFKELSKNMPNTVKRNLIITGMANYCKDRSEFFEHIGYTSAKYKKICDSLRKNGISRINEQWRAALNEVEHNKVKNPVVPFSEKPWTFEDYQTHNNIMCLDEF